MRDVAACNRVAAVFRSVPGGVVQRLDGRPGGALGPLGDGLERPLLDRAVGKAQRGALLEACRQRRTE